VEAAAAAVDKLVLLAVQAVLAAAVLVQVAQTRNQTELLEQRTPVAVAEVVADRQAAPAVRES
jgi:uncharacterized membrane protein